MQKITYLGLLLLLILSVGCGSPPSTPESGPVSESASTTEPDSAPEDPSTPESTIQALKTAAKNRDALAMSSLYSPATVSFMNEIQMPYCFEGYVLEVHPDQVPEHKKKPSPDQERNISVYRAAKEAGVDESILNEITQAGSRGSLQEFYTRAADSISNKVAFLASSLEITNEFEKKIGTDNDAFAMWNNATFGDIQENGDEATVKVSMNGRDAEFYFQRVDNQWRFHIPSDAR